MYESARTHMKPRDIRRRACSLMRKCWKTLLIAAVLMCLFGWISTAVEAHGKRLAQQAYDACKEAYLADHPMPEGEEDRAAWAYFYEWLAIHQAEDEYDAVYAPWKWAARGIDLIDLIFSCVIAVRLCRGLLTALHGGECTPHCLRSGWARTSTVCWLAIQRELRIGLWALLPLLVSASIAYVVSSWGNVIGVIGALLTAAVVLWATLYYALAEVHLADDRDGARTASDCLRRAVDDADAFGLWNMCKVLLPAIGLLLLSMAMSIIGIFVPAVSVPAAILVALADLLCLIVKYACYACIYDEMRQRSIAAQENNPGLTRAKALESGSL